MVARLVSEPDGYTPSDQKGGAGDLGVDALSLLGDGAIVLSIGARTVHELPCISAGISAQSGGRLKVFIMPPRLRYTVEQSAGTCASRRAPRRLPPAWTGFQRQHAGDKSDCGEVSRTDTGWRS